MPFGSPHGTNDVRLLLVACLAYFVTNCRPTCRFALGFPCPLKKHVQQETTSEKANRC